MGVQQTIKHSPSRNGSGWHGLPLLGVGEVGVAQAAHYPTATGLIAANDAKGQHVQIEEEPCKRQSARDLRGGGNRTVLPVWLTLVYWLTS